MEWISLITETKSTLTLDILSKQRCFTDSSIYYFNVQTETVFESKMLVFMRILYMTTACVTRGTENTGLRPWFDPAKG